MELELVPLLQLQRDLYDIPNGQARFQIYLETMLNADASDAELLPLVSMNPMGKAHIPALLDDLLALDAEAIAAQAIAAHSAQFQTDPGSFKLGLVVADDRMGGWTNRYTCEFTARFELAQSLKRNWLSVILWTSETPSVQTVWEETLIALYRTAYIQRHGAASTLQAMLNQEGYAMAMAGCQQPTLDAEDLAYTREVIAPHLSTQDYPTIMACLFGDRAAQSLGYPPQGLSDRAGFAMALHQARHHQTAPLQG
jgi:hypothetical protein